MKEQSANPISEGEEQSANAVVQWDSISEDFLQNIVSMTGIKEWDQVNSMMKAQFPEKMWESSACKERWYSVLEPMVAKKGWNEKEELELLVAHKLCQNKWSNVGALLGGRNNNNIKNRYYSIFRKVKNKVKRLETIFNSRIELLEIYYMMDQMEHHLMQPCPPVPQKGKRGKDFIYTLLQHLHIEEVARFRVELVRATGRQESLTGLWEEMGTPIEKAKIALAERIDSLAGKKICVNFNRVLTPVETTLHPSPELQPEKQKIQLPCPDLSRAAGTLNDEEKVFIQSQAFACKTPAPSAIHEAFSTGTQPGFQTPALASSVQIYPTINQTLMPVNYGSFTDYTAISRTGMYPISTFRVLSATTPTVQMIQTPNMMPAVYSAIPYSVMPQILHSAPSLEMYVAQRINPY